MKLETIIETIKTIKKGTFISIEYKTIKKPLAKHKESIIEKHSIGTYRLGIEYANMAANKDKETGPLPYGSFKLDFKDYIIEYGDKKYLRVYTSVKHKTISKWFLNGVETTKEYLIENGYISNSKSKPTECFNINIDNIIRIGSSK